MAPTKRVAIIGAGASGITAIKCCLDEGLEPVCIEKSDNIGGLWRYTETPVEGQGCVMKSTVINTSKEMMSYSDFPIPAKYPIYMHNTQVFEYFQLYVEKFGLEKYIQFRTSVVSVEKTEDFSETGQWKVTTKLLTTEEEKVEVFDAVLACTGHHADKNVPNFPGLSNFKGKIIHSHDYRRPEQFDEKNVLVIGIGNSGGDISVELSRRAKQVYLSTRRGTWILHRIDSGGYPADMAYNRVLTAISGKCPNVIAKLAEMKTNSRIDHKLYGLKPDYGIFAQHPMVNDDMPNRIICGALQIKTDVKQFTETGVQFIDGTSAEIDAVILATGYSFGFPYLDKQILEVKENHVHLYKNMFMPDLEKQTLAFIGFIQPLGAIMPISELQCRVATRIFKGTSPLPTKGEMWSDIRLQESAMAQRYVKSRRHTIQVDYWSYMDQLADLIGCKPDLYDLLKSDPKLFLKVMFGPITPYQFRLFGPLPWSGARDAIMTQWERTAAPLKTRPLTTSKTSDDKGYAMKFAIFLILFFVIRFFIW